MYRPRFFRIRRYRLRRRDPRQGKPEAPATAQIRMLITVLQPQSHAWPDANSLMFTGSM